MKFWKWFETGSTKRSQCVVRHSLLFIKSQLVCKIINAIRAILL